MTKKLIEAKRKVIDDFYFLLTSTKGYHVIKKFDDGSVLINTEAIDEAYEEMLRQLEKGLI